MTAEDFRYRAFISYSHRDAALTRRLHRALESYRVPSALRRTAQADGRPLPARIHPVFRDRDELATSAGLSASIEAALEQSAALVVVCSPDAVASPWVNEEIRTFRSRWPQRPVFAFVAAGDPGLDPRREPARAALPPALVLARVDQPDGALGEPVAADAREQGDGFHAAFLKLAAGLLGVGFDQLRRREQRRRQQRWALAGAVSMVLSAVFAVLAWQATVARDQARAAQAVAELELQSERETRNFLLSVFQLADANEARGNSVTVREVLDKAVARIDAIEFSRPVIRARYLATMGQAYSSLGLNRRSAELLQSSLAALPDAVKAQEVRTQRADSQVELADVLYDMGEYAQAMQLLEQALVGEATLSPTQRARIANLRGEVLSYQERDAEARQSYEEALAAIDGATLDSETQALLRGHSISGLAQLALFAGDHAQAWRQYTQALAIMRPVLGDSHPATISALASRGSSAHAAGNTAAARADWEAALAAAQSVFDPLSPQAGTLKNNLGRLLLETGDLAAAEPLLRDALASDRVHRSAGFDDLAYPLNNLGYVLAAQGHGADAEPLYLEALQIAEASGHRMLGPILANLADLRCAEDDAAGGTALAARAVGATRDEYGEAHAYTAQAQLVHAWCSARTGAAIDPAAAQRDVVVVVEKWGSDSPFARRAHAQLDELRRQQVDAVPTG